MEPFLVYDGKKFMRRRLKLGLGQKEIDQRLKTILDRAKLDETQAEALRQESISYKTVSRIENSDRKVTLVFYEFYAKALEKPLDFFRFDPAYDHDEVRALGDTVRAMVSAAYQTGVSYLKHPYPIKLRPTRKGKITDRAITDDPTLALDQVMADAMKCVVQHLSAQEWHPFNKAVFIQCDEEAGAKKVPDDSAAKPKYALSTDSCDHTDAAANGTGGACYASVYQFGVGVVAAAGVDITRGVLLSRVRGAHTEAIQLSHRASDEPMPTDFTPRGSVITLLPSRLASLSNASICIYLGKAYRVPLTASLGARLLCGRKDITLTSVGGSRGAMLVAEGRIDSALEFVKGFKHLDGFPGLFLADGAGAAVIHLNNSSEKEEMCFGSDPEFEEIFDLPEETWSAGLENLRYKFIVAGTSELAGEIYDCLAVKP